MLNILLDSWNTWGNKSVKAEAARGEAKKESVPIADFAKVTLTSLVAQRRANEAVFAERQLPYLLCEIERANNTGACQTTFFSGSAYGTPVDKHTFSSNELLYYAAPLLSAQGFAVQPSLLEDGPAVSVRWPTSLE